jgi:branched-chain amino acid transport system permease protein
VVVSVLPQVLLHYADRLPLVASPGGGGLQPNDAARFLYGAAVVGALILASGGLAGLARRFRGVQPTPKEKTA